MYKVGRPIKQLKRTVICSPSHFNFTHVSSLEECIPCVEECMPSISIFIKAILPRVKFFFSENYWFFSGYWLLLWAGILVSLTNFYYILALQKHRWKTWGSSLSHIGFGVLLVGIIISQYKQQVLTENAISEGFLQAYFFEKNITDVEEQSQWRISFVTTYFIEKNPIQKSRRI